MPDSLVEQFERLRDSGSVDVFSFLSSQRQLSTQDQLRVLLLDQQKRWMAGQPLKVEDYLAQLPEIASDLPAVLELAVAEYTARLSSGSTPDVEELVVRFPQIADVLRERIRHQQSLPRDKDKGISTETMIPEQVRAALLNGRYRKVRELGEGAFGQVYLAFDEDLQRQVAIKIPTAERFLRAQDADLFLSEARTVASLNHPHIVPVYDMGRTPEGAVFVVSRFIEGGTLKERLQSLQMSPEDSARLLKTIAEALHYAHQRRLIHRDVKPDNILIEASTNTPFVADFGLAIREEDYAKQLGIAGTPAYMSPEQARGEGHRLDCRSDVFSLGVILYELLTGQRPFRGSTPNEVLHQVVSVDPVPPRSVQENVSAELERICLKAMSKQASDRYASATELADDLQTWLSPASRPSSVTPSEISVIPKGLRSFDAGDADFFLDLLPGPRNREGLPESISFWKQRIEQTDPEQTFSVGLIYGPSGCGKSSLVKAGLLPHLSEDLIAVFVEATPDETEQRILRGLRKRVVSLATSGEPPGASRGSVFQPHTPGTSALRATPAVSALPLTEARARELDQSLKTPATSLAETMAALRRGTGPKVVIIIDQFEQWLHTHRAEPESDLVQALRHCDGGRLQAVVMIRDDFAMAAARFMDALDIPILQGVNFATVDLFDVSHAAKVLTKFGRAFHQLPSGSQPLTAEQEQFVSAVATGLAQDGKVVSVRLALFAEMIKNKPWTKKTLQDVGGTEGIGVNFLEETFASRTANPKHRQHQAAARAVLKALLPEVGTDIKGHMRSHEELLEASGYHDRPSDFNELLRIVDGELRLITPTDPQGDSLPGERLGVSPPSSASTSPNSSPTAPRYNQLTHDYLVPPLREWLTRKQRETRKGRAELKLEERSAIWNAKRENKQLPTVTEWLSIRVLTDSKRLTESQRAMMRKASRVHGILWGGLFLTMLLLGAGGKLWMSSEQEANLWRLTKASVETMQDNLGPRVPSNLKKLHELPDRLVVPELQARFRSTDDDGHKLWLAFALVSYGELDAEYLASWIHGILYEDSRNYVTALQANPQKALAILKAEAMECNDNSLWHHKAKLAITALGLGDTELALDVCAFENRPDPIQRTLFINEFSQWDIDLKVVLEAVKNSDSPALRSAICLAVGSINQMEIIDANKESWTPVASRWYVEKGDTSTHSAAGWMLGRWELPMPDIPSQGEVTSERDWYVNSVGLTMLKIPIGTFREQVEDSEQHEDREVTIDQPFWLADCEVSCKQFTQFLNDPNVPPEEKPNNSEDIVMWESQDSGFPVSRVSRYDAILYCNWLSRREGFEPCYVPTGKQEIRSYLPADEFIILPSGADEAWSFLPSATGYRLPLEVAWEYACRAGTTTDYAFGDFSDLGTSRYDFSYSYATFDRSPSRCGSSLPNAWGLYDMHGNAGEWCSYRTTDDPGASSGWLSSVRGGNWSSGLAATRSTSREIFFTPNLRTFEVGFRVARSVLPAATLP